ncbi:MAG TPA: histidine kinase [Streptosporangiaceae bacterium]|jgi:two-component system sensor histidine kinase DesK
MRRALDALRRPALAGPYLILAAVHVPLIAQAPLYSIFGSLGGIGPSGYPWLAVLCGVAIFGLQLRHSLALARGERPRGGVWTLLALAALAYVPLHWLGLNWISAQLVLLGSIPMVLDGWLAVIAIAGACSYIGFQFAAVFPAHAGYADYVYLLTYYTATIPIVPAALYASARLVRVAGELRGTQNALTQAAVGRERLRVSRDLHDLLGHSLSAISLKGDLAARLLRRDRQAAVREIQNLTEVASEALAGLRAITAGSPKITLADELDSSSALLAAAGLTVRVHGEVPAIPAAVDEALAWAVREGTTNILRHATAATAEITLHRDDGLARLRMLNDGAPPVPPADGSDGARPAGEYGGYGLSSLAARLEELSGTLSHGRLSDDRFQLTAQVPVTASEEPHWTASGCSSPKTST